MTHRMGGKQGVCQEKAVIAQNFSFVQEGASLSYPPMMLGQEAGTTVYSEGDPFCWHSTWIYFYQFQVMQQELRDIPSLEFGWALKLSKNVASQGLDKALAFVMQKTVVHLIKGQL